MVLLNLKSRRTNYIILKSKLSKKEKQSLIDVFLKLTLDLEKRLDSFRVHDRNNFEKLLVEFRAVNETNIRYYFTTYVRECPVCRGFYLLPKRYGYCSKECQVNGAARMGELVCVVCGRYYFGYKEKGREPVCSNRCLNNSHEIIIENSLQRVFGTKDLKIISSLISKNIQKKELENEIT